MVLGVKEGEKQWGGKLMDPGLEEEGAAEYKNTIEMIHHLNGKEG